MAGVGDEVFMEMRRRPARTMRHPDDSHKAITTTRYVDVAQRAAELGAMLVPGLIFLPDNFESATTEDELRFHGEATTLAKIFRAQGLSVTRLGAESQPTAFIHNRSHDWAMPILFIGAELLKQNPDMISQALGLVQQYVLDQFKGVTGERKVVAELVVEDRKAGLYNRLTYDGPPEGLNTLAAALKALARR